jgi:hypothetical protein
MRNLALVVVLLSVAVLVSPQAEAGDRVGIGVKAGTTGLGVDLTGRITDWFSLRGSYSAKDVSTTHESSGIEYDDDITLGAYGVMFDFHPFKNNFRLTAGYMRNRTGVDVTSTPTQNTEIGDTTYTPAEIGTLTGTIDFKKDVPYFGIGYGNAAKGPHRVKFLLDLGVLSQGTAQVALTSSTGLVSQSDLDKEIQQVEDDIKNTKLYPVLSLGLSFRL